MTDEQLLDHIGNIIDAKLEPVNKKLDRLDKKFDKEIKGNAQVFEEVSEMSKKLTILDDHEKRIQKLEDDNVFLPH